MNRRHRKPARSPGEFREDPWKWDWFSVVRSSLRTTEEAGDVSWPFGVWSDGSAWALTHLPTGLRVGRTRRKRDAISWAGELVEFSEGTEPWEKEREDLDLDWLARVLREHPHPDSREGS